MKVLILQDCESIVYDNVLQVSTNYDEAIPSLDMEHSLIISIVRMFEGRKVVVRFKVEEGLIMTVTGD